MNKEKIAIGEYLKQARENQSLTQNQVATHLGYVSAQFVSNWERGLSLPPLHKLRAIAELLKLEHRTTIDFYLKYKRAQISQALGA